MVEGSGFENRRRCKLSRGSNPFSSATGELSSPVAKEEGVSSCLTRLFEASLRETNPFSSATVFLSELSSPYADRTAHVSPTRPGA